MLAHKCHKRLVKFAKLLLMEVTNNFLLLSIV